MNPLKLSARFAAHVCYTEVSQGTKTRDEALRFAEQHWRTFLPSAAEGWGKLLTRIARPRRIESACVHRRHRRELGGAVGVA